jgi:hypothetical protein
MLDIERVGYIDFSNSQIKFRGSPGFPGKILMKDQTLRPGTALDPDADQTFPREHLIVHAHVGFVAATRMTTPSITWALKTHLQLSAHLHMQEM